MSKYISIIIAVLSFGSGMFLHFKLTKAPICNCPEVKFPKQQSALKVNSLDISELKKLKIGKKFTFNHNPSFHADKIIIVQCGDTMN